MRPGFTILLLTALLAAAHAGVQAQIVPDLKIRHRADIPSTCGEMTMTMKYDAFERHYIYVAGKEGGLRIYDILNIDAPVLVGAIPIDSFEHLEVMSVDQTGNYLLLALGNHFGDGQSPGVAVVDVINPYSPVVTHVWTLPESGGGAGIIRADGDFVYLGAMKHGLVVLGISTRGRLEFLSRFVPDIDYPTPNPNPDLYNARGLAVRGDLVYLCYDAGGLRIINIADKQNPVETGRYSNPIMNGLPRAYNNIVVEDSLAYIAVDYCGMEIVNVADTGHITLTGWWNPYGCPNNNWFTSPVHANEIAFDRERKLLFISTGKSDMVVVDVADPTSPDSVGAYGGTENDRGSWGIALHRDKIFISYVCALIPFASNWTGVTILTYGDDGASATPVPAVEEFALYPSPTSDRITLHGIESIPEGSILLTDILGRTFIPPFIRTSSSGTEIDVSALPAGVYALRVRTKEGMRFGRFVKRT